LLTPLWGASAAKRENARGKNYFRDFADRLQGMARPAQQKTPERPRRLKTFLVEKECSILHTLKKAPLERDR